MTKPNLNHSRIVKVLAILLFGLAFFAVAAAATLGVVAYRYQDRFYPGVGVAGIGLAGKSEAEGKALLQKRTDQYLAHPVDVVVPDLTKPSADSPNAYADLSLATTAGTLGLTFPNADAEGAAWRIGHAHQPLTWLKETLPILFQGYQSSFTYHIDPTAIQTFIHTTVLPKIGSPVPASIEVSGSTVSVKPPTPGFQVDEKKLAAELATALEAATDNDTTYLRAPVTEVDSPITQQTVRPLADELDHLGSMKITLTGNGNFNVTPTRTQILSWFDPVQDDKGTLGLSLDKDSLTSYLSPYKELDQTQSLAAMTKSLGSLIGKSAADVTGLSQWNVGLVTAPVKTVTADANTPGLYPGKYIEINLAQQKMYLFIGNDLQDAFGVSSGMWSTPTPTGTFYIHTKTRVAWSAAFGLYMPYWQNFYNDSLPVGEYGIHGLPYWPNGYVEGENHIGTPVSHGCVRLGKGNDEFVYNWTEEGTPVYIH